MPKFNILASVSITLLGAIIGYESVKYIKQPNANNRYLASTTMSKLGSEQFAKTLFEIKISNETLAESNDEASTITVVIKSLKAIPQSLTYKWTLPDRSQIIEGNESGPLEDFAMNQTKEFKIKIKGYSREVKNYISFKVEGNLEEHKIDRDILISSRPEDSFEYVVQEYEKNKAIDTKNKNKLGKIENQKPPIDIKKVTF